MCICMYSIGSQSVVFKSSRASITWELVRYTDAWAPLHTYYSFRDPGSGTQHFISVKPGGDSDAGSSFDNHCTGEEQP